MNRRRLLWLCLLLAAVLSGGYYAGRERSARQHLDLARIALQRSRLRLARQEIELADRFGTESAESAFLKARLARRLGEVELMKQTLARAERLGLDRIQSERELLLLRAQNGDLAGLEAELPALLESGEDLHDVCEAFVLGCLMSYRINDALMILDGWSADFPESPVPLLLRGRILHHRQGIKEAHALFEQAWNLDQSYGTAAYAVAQSCEAQNQFDTALQWYQRSQDTLHTRQPGLVGAASMYRRTSRLDAARQAIEAAFACDSTESQVAWLQAGRTLLDARSAVWIEAGEIDKELGNHADAVKHFRLALDNNPGAWKVRFSLGTSLRLLGEDSAAQQELSQFQETSTAIANCEPWLDRVWKDPADVEARFEIGRTFFRYVSPSQGVIWLKSVLAIDPQHAGALAALRAFEESRKESDR